MSHHCITKSTSLLPTTSPLLSSHYIYEDPTSINIPTSTCNSPAQTTSLILIMKETMADFPFRVSAAAKSEPRRLLLQSGPAGKTHAHLKADGPSFSSKYRRLGPKITETVKGKLKLGAKMIRVGGLEKMFRRAFENVREGEELLKASPCYLSTTAGPMAGLLFISSDKIAFCSDRSIKFSNSAGETVRFQYKVVIPVKKIERADRSENVKRPSEKYLEVVTDDGFEFWFMGLVDYNRTFNCIQQAICQ